ncbi:MAG: phosphoglycerate dehydrogenase [Acidobacteriota bacterium]|nr:phosphoglycerate dehydrogenase [Acidobacteriota bacterium]
MKIVVAEKIAPAAMQLLQAIPGAEVLTPEEFAAAPEAAVAGADALIVRSAVQADAALIDAGQSLRVIGRAGVGVDNIDVETATRRGIVVMNAPGASAVSVAELTLGLMLTMARHIAKADQSTRAGKWEKKSLQGTELAGKTLGIIGLGRIGTEVARRAQAFGMKVIGSDPYLSPARAKELNIELVTLEQVYAQADYLSLHLALTHQTAGMIDAGALAQMKKGVRLVNCARGELVDEAALEAALRSGHVAAAALDVFHEEPARNTGLLSAPNLVATPHLGASTKEGQEAVGIQIARQVRDYLLQGVAQNAVNLPSLTDTEYKQIEPYIGLAGKLGRFAAQLFASNLAEIEVRFEGQVGAWKTQLIRASAVAAVLQSDRNEPTNLINALAAAEERGVVVREQRAEAETKANVIRLKLTGPTGAVSCSGTLVNGRPRLTQLNSIDIESQLEGNFIVVANLDAPGVVGGIGTLLGRHGINIARLSLGREDGQALAIVQVDEAVSAEVMAGLRGVASVQRVYSVIV